MPVTLAVTEMFVIVLLAPLIVLFVTVLVLVAVRTFVGVMVLDRVAMIYRLGWIKGTLTQDLDSSFQ